MTDKIGILGHTGFVGSNLVSKLAASKRPFVGGSRRNGVDARDTESIIKWVTLNNITSVVNLAAECGGIGLNQQKPAELWLSTAQITASVLEAAVTTGVKKLVMVGTVCSYAKHCPVPFKESDLMCHGEPEETNQAYGLAKLSGLFGAKAYHKQYGLNVTNLVPVNMYGPHDHFDLNNSHVIPALIRKMFDAQSSGSDVVLWGDGSATREFLFAEDFASAVLLAIEKNVGPEFINIGSGHEISIKDLANKIATMMKFKGQIKWDTTKPNGQPRRCLDISRAKALLGFEATTSFDVGLKRTIDWYAANR